MSKERKCKEKDRTKSTLLKIIICIVAAAFTALAAVFDTPWLCAPSVAILAVGVMLDE